MPSNHATKYHVKSGTYAKYQRALAVGEKAIAVKVRCPRHNPEENTRKGSHKMVVFKVGDGTSRNDVSPYELSMTPGPQNESSQKHNVPVLKHPRHYSSNVRIVRCIITGMYQARDSVFLGR